MLGYYYKLTYIYSNKNLILINFTVLYYEIERIRILQINLSYNVIILYTQYILKYV